MLEAGGDLLVGGWRRGYLPATGYAVLRWGPYCGCHTVCGDCDGNGQGPDVLDVLQTARVAAGLIVPSTWVGACCDVDSDLAVSILDALQLARMAVGQTSILTCP